MGWDINLFVECDGHRVKITGDLDIGYTHNTNKMIRAAGGTWWNAEDLEKMTAGELEPKLAAVILELERGHRRYDAMNPSNGWGSREGLVAELRKLHAACQRFPSARVLASF